MKMTLIKEAEHRLGEIDRLLSYAESPSCGKVVIMAEKDFRRIEAHVAKTLRILPFLRRGVA